MDDIVDLILADHKEFRRQFEAVESMRNESQAPRGWQELARFLEIHALAEEAVLYPELAKLSSQASEETKDAVHEHNEIRDALGEVEEHDPGTELYWLAIAQVKAANDHHMAEEEQEFLPDFAKQTDQVLRQDLAARFEDYKANAPKSPGHQTKDPEEFVREAQS